MNHPVIRPAEEADLPALGTLVREYWAFEQIGGFDAAQIQSQLKRLLQTPHLGRILVADLDQELAGYIITVLVFSLEHKGLTAEIDELYVAHPQRRLGLAGALLNAAETFAIDAGCTGMFLQLGHDNHPARALYRRHGFHARRGFDMLEKPLP